MINVSIEHSRPVPKWAQDLVSSLGRNPYDDPLFRLIWAPESIEIIGGFWEDVQRREYREVTKYPGVQRFVLERWEGPERFGTPESWDRMVDAWGYNPCGPYPHHGSYEHTHTFEQAGQYVPLDPTLLRLVIAAVKANKLTSKYDRFLAIRAAKEYEQKEMDRKFDDVFDDAKLRFFGATVGYGGHSVNKIDSIKINSAQAVPRKLRTPHKGITQL